MSSPSTSQTPTSSGSPASDGTDNTVVELSNDIGSDDTNSLASNGQELNQRLSNLEKTLAGLRDELESTSSSFAQAQTLNGSDNEQLGIELQGAREQLKSLEANYEKLGKHSSALSSQQSEIAESLETRSEALAERIDHLQFELAAQIVKMSDESVKQFDQLSTEQAQLEQRSRELAEQAEQLKDSIDAGITEVRAAVKALEIKLLDQLQVIEAESRQRDRDNAEAIEGVSHTLSATAERLEQADADQQAALKAGMTELDNKLRERTDALQADLDSTNQTVAEHGSEITALHVNDVVLASQIETLEDTTSKQHQAHLALADRVRSGFRWQYAGLAVLALALLGFVLIQQQNWNDAATNEAAQQQAINEQAAVQQQALADTDARQSALKTAVSGLIHETEAQHQRDEQLAANLDDAKTRLQAQITALNEKLQGLDDQAQSLNGRLNASSPFQQFGDDNVIHGPEWLAKQDASAFMVRLLTVDDKQALYDIADRYSYFLKQKLAWYPVSNASGKQRYVLLAGIYKDETAAQQLIQRMPAPSFDEAPAVESMTAIQKKLQALTASL